MATSYMFGYGRLVMGAITYIHFLIDDSNLKLAMSDNTDTEINTVIHNDPEINPGQYPADSEKLTSAFDQDLSEYKINTKVDSYELWNNEHAQISIR